MILESEMSVVMDFLLFFSFALTLVIIGVVQHIKSPEEKTLVEIVRKGEMVNTERKSWSKRGRFIINLNWIVVFQEINSRKEIELEVSGYKYDDLKVGQTGFLYHRNGLFLKFEVCHAYSEN